MARPTADHRRQLSELQPMRAPDPHHFTTKRSTTGHLAFRRRASRRASPIRAALVGVALIAIVAAGCLPSGTRVGGSASQGSGGPGSSGGAGPSVPTSPTPRPPIVPPTPTPRPTFLVYTVKRGDSLNTIAHRFDTTARSIAFWNRSTYPSLDPDSTGYRPGLLKIGWTLFLIPNDVVDEQEFPEPSTDAPDPADESAAPG
jgi:hypothetical protein